MRALAEGAVIGGYDARRWRSGERPRGVERFVICGDGDDLGPVADRAALVAAGRTWPASSSTRLRT